MSALPFPELPERPVDRRAREFHEANPHVLAKLREIARTLRTRGVKCIGIQVLFERLRWLSWFTTDGDRYRLNNSHAAWYARELMRVDPELRGMFRTRNTPHDPEFYNRDQR